MYVCTHLHIAARTIYIQQITQPPPALQHPHRIAHMFIDIEGLACRVLSEQHI
jgi:hypothetical protein